MADKRKKREVSSKLKLIEEVAPKLAGIQKCRYCEDVRFPDDPAKNTLATHAVILSGVVFATAEKHHYLCQRHAEQYYPQKQKGVR